MNKYILARIDKNCKAWEGHHRLEKGKPNEEISNGVNGDKAFWKMESVNNHWQERKYLNSDNNKTKQNKTTGNLCLQKQSMTTY